MNNFIQKTIKINVLNQDKIVSYLLEGKTENNQFIVDGFYKENEKESKREVGKLTVLKVLENEISEQKYDWVAGKIDEEIFSLNDEISQDCQVSLVTLKDPESLVILRKTVCFIMGYALKNLFPEVILVSNGIKDEECYCDFSNVDIKIKDLILIENEIKRIIKEKNGIEKRRFFQAEILKVFANNDYKKEVVKEYFQEVKEENKQINVYQMKDFIDISFDVLLPNISRIKALKMLRLSGVYFKGNANKEMLSRIYGIAFLENKSLKEYLSKLEEAKERDHNRLGKELDYFVNDEIVGQGLPLLTPKGTTLKKILQDFVEKEEEKLGFMHTQTPFMAKSDLYKMSGHWDHYKDSMFIIPDEKNDLALRPMTCPFHFILYNSSTHSYRDLPISYAETSTLFRNESSGEMHGLIRVRQFTLSDGHIICLESQLEEEFKKCVKLVRFILNTIGLTNYTFRLSKWDPNNRKKYIDNEVFWEETQIKMRNILNKLNISYVEVEGEAAFYGPKLDIQMKNVYGKEDTIITVQIDFALPHRFKMTYVNEQGEEKVPYVIHRSSIGCYERTIALLIEKYSGKLPFWMAPIQIIILTITEDVHSYAQDLKATFLQEKLRCEVDYRSYSLKKKVKLAQLNKIPLIITVGKQEKENQAISVRTLKGNIINNISIDNFIKEVNVMNEKKMLNIIFDLNN